MRIRLQVWFEKSFEALNSTDHSRCCSMVKIWKTSDLLLNVGVVISVSFSGVQVNIDFALTKSFLWSHWFPLLVKLAISYLNWKPAWEKENRILLLVAAKCWLPMVLMNKYKFYLCRSFVHLWSTFYPWWPYCINLLIKERRLSHNLFEFTSLNWQIN